MHQLLLLFDAVMQCRVRTLRSSDGDGSADSVPCSRSKQRLSSLTTDGVAATWPYTPDLSVRPTASRMTRPADRSPTRSLIWSNHDWPRIGSDVRLQGRRRIYAFLLSPSECCDRQQFVRVGDRCRHRRPLSEITVGRLRLTFPIFLPFPPQSAAKTAESSRYIMRLNWALFDNRSYYLPFSLNGL